MKTWDAYKDHVKKVDPDAKRDLRFHIWVGIL